MPYVKRPPFVRIQHKPTSDSLGEHEEGKAKKTMPEVPTEKPGCSALPEVDSPGLIHTSDHYYFLPRSGCIPQVHGHGPNSVMQQCCRVEPCEQCLGHRKSRSPSVDNWSPFSRGWRGRPTAHSHRAVHPSRVISSTDNCCMLRFDGDMYPTGSHVCTLSPLMEAL